MRKRFIVSFAFILVLFISSCKSVKKTFVNQDLINESTQVLNLNSEVGKEQIEGCYQMQKRGVDFFALGKEPFWLVEIGFDKYIKLTTLSGRGIDTITVPVIDSVVVRNLPIVNYKGSSKQGEILVSIEQKACADGSSSIARNYEVHVSVKRPNDKKHAKFKGCGEYFGHVKLHGAWALKSINGAIVDTLKNNHPYMELYLNNGQVKGFLGCNSFSTRFFFGRDQIFFKHIMRTKMACAFIDLEKKFSKVLSNSVFNYRFEGLNLILENNTDTLVFKNMD